MTANEPHAKASAQPLHALTITSQPTGHMNQQRQKKNMQQPQVIQKISATPNVRERERERHTEKNMVKLESKCAVRANYLPTFNFSHAILVTWYELNSFRHIFFSSSSTLSSRCLRFPILLVSIFFGARFDYCLLSIYFALLVLELMGIFRFLFMEKMKKWLKMKMSHTRTHSHQQNKNTR